MTSVKFDDGKDDWSILPWEVVSLLTSGNRKPPTRHSIDNLFNYSFNTNKDQSFANWVAHREDLISAFYYIAEMLLPNPTSFGALHWVVKVMSFGAKKYSRDNWKGLDHADLRYTNAFFRHLSKHSLGAKYDDETNLPHLAHCLCNIVFLLYFHEQKNPQKRP